MPQYPDISWAAKPACSQSLQLVVDEVERSHDPLKDDRYFVLTLPVAKVKKRSKKQKLPAEGTSEKKPTSAAVTAGFLTDWDWTFFRSRLTAGLSSMPRKGSRAASSSPESLGSLGQRAGLLGHRQKQRQHAEHVRQAALRPKLARAPPRHRHQRRQRRRPQRHPAPRRPTKTLSSSGSVPTTASRRSPTPASHAAPTPSAIPPAHLRPPKDPRPRPRSDKSDGRAFSGGLRAVLGTDEGADEPVKTKGIAPTDPTRAPKASRSRISCRSTFPRRHRSGRRRRIRTRTEGDPPGAATGLRGLLGFLGHSYRGRRRARRAQERAARRRRAHRARCRRDQRTRRGGARRPGRRARRRGRVRSPAPRAGRQRRPGRAGHAAGARGARRAGRLGHGHRRPSLDDVYLKYTGRRFEEADAAAQEVSR